MILSSFPSKHWNPGPVCFYALFIHVWCISTGIMILSSFPSKHWNPQPCLFLYTLELLSYPSKHWNPGPIIDLYYTLEFWPHPFKHWNSGPVFMIIGILALFLQSWEFLYHPSTANIEILALSLKTLEFLSSFYKHWNSHLILPNTGILALFLMHIGFLILSFPTLEFWPYIFINIEILIFSLH